VNKVKIYLTSRTVWMGLFTIAMAAGNAYINGATIENVVLAAIGAATVYFRANIKSML
jgi:hypothetical protein